MNGLQKRAEEIARAAAGRQVRRVASYLADLLKGAGIDVEGTRLVVSGRGLAKRWLTDGRLRYLKDNLK